MRPQRRTKAGSCHGERAGWSRSAAAAGEILAFALLAWCAAATAADPPAAAPAPTLPVRTSCTACHGNADVFGPDLAREIIAIFADDVHAQVGLSCHDCHGGNPDPALAEDMEAAMQRQFAGNPYRGTPARGEVPAFCARWRMTGVRV